MDLQRFVERYPRLYHMAEVGTWPSIRDRGLLSASAVLDLFGIAGRQRAPFEARQRTEMMTVLPGQADAIVLRDQKPMPPDRLVKALPSGVSPEAWYRLINGKVFFWAEEHRLFRLLGARAYRNIPHDVLTLNTASIVAAHLERLWVCHMNSGNTWPAPHARTPDIFQRMSNYPVRKNGNPIKPVVEVVVDEGVPDIARHVVALRRMQGQTVIASTQRTKNRLPNLPR